MEEIKIIKGKISVGVAHPLYGKEVDLYVLKDNTGYNGKETWVRTVNAVLMPNIALIYKNGKFLREEERPATLEYIEGWLIKD